MESYVPVPQYNPETFSKYHNEGKVTEALDYLSTVLCLREKDAIDIIVKMLRTGDDNKWSVPMNKILLQKAIRDGGVDLLTIYKKAVLRYAQEVC